MIAGMNYRHKDFFKRIIWQLEYMGYFVGDLKEYMKYTVKFGMARYYKTPELHENTR